MAIRWQGERFQWYLKQNKGCKKEEAGIIRYRLIYEKIYLLKEGLA